jgi:hypothetical protein
MRTDAQEMAIACRIAQANNMFVIDRPGRGGETDHILYRKTPGRALRLGKRRDPADFRRLVERAARTQ